MNVFLVFLSGVLDTYPLIPLRYIPFKGKLRLPFWKIMVIVSLVMVLEGFSYTRLFFQGGTSHLLIHRLLFMCVYVAISFIVIKESFFKICFFFLLMIPISLSITTFAYGIESSAFFSQYDALTTDVVVRLILIALFYPPCIFFFRNMMRPVMDIGDYHVWTMMWPFPLIFALISSFITRYSFPYMKPSVIAVFRLLVLLGDFFACYALVGSLNRIEKNAMEKESGERAKLLLSVQSEQYQQISTSLEEMRKSRHDLRHHLSLLSAMAEQGDITKLQEYLSTLTASQQGRHDQVLCENYTVNAILSHFVARAHELGIRTECHLDIPQKSYIDDIDLCVLLGNLLENAIDGASSVKDGTIAIRSLLTGEEFFFTVDNPYGKPLVINNGQLVSTKQRDGREGIGIKSVEAVVERYCGDMRIEHDGGHFRVSVVLSHRKEAEA